MTLDEYQAKSLRTFREGTDPKQLLVEYSLGIAGEGGEVANYVKKSLFYTGRSLDPQVLKDELGDVLWYAAALASLTGLTLSDVAKGNVEKLLARYPVAPTKGV